MPDDPAFIERLPRTRTTCSPRLRGLFGEQATRRMRAEFIRVQVEKARLVRHAQVDGLWLPDTAAGLGEAVAGGVACDPGVQYGGFIRGLSTSPARRKLSNVPLIFNHVPFEDCQLSG